MVSINIVCKNLKINNDFCIVKIILVLRVNQMEEFSLTNLMGEELGFPII